MRPVLPKIHLVDLSEWPTCFNGLEARCQKPLEKARMEMGAASHVVQEKMTEAEFFLCSEPCRKCLAIGPIQPSGNHCLITWLDL